MVGNQTNFIVVNQSANSLYSLIADGQRRATSLGRDTWKTLIGSQASLQHNCNKEGFNVKCTEISHSKARIGIVSNNNDDGCTTCDSRIGFGTGGKHDDKNTCGNEATHSPDNEEKHIKAMGYILVQWQETDMKNLETCRGCANRITGKCKLDTKVVGWFDSSSMAVGSVGFFVSLFFFRNTKQLSSI